MFLKFLRNERITPVRIIVLGFIGVILLGGILLSLPISSIDNHSTPFIDSLFTSASATCVTGLVTVDTGTHWSLFGKIIILILIQIGGLGFMSIVTMFALLIGKKITLKDRLIMQESLSSLSLQGLVKLSKHVLFFTFAVEGIGALLLSFKFVPQYGWLKGIWYGIFHSISAFCNAGFDLFGHFSSLTNYATSPLVILTISALIIIGGLGFAVWIDLYSYKKNKKLMLHTKIAVTVTIGLIVLGTVFMFIFEHKNKATMGDMSLGNKLLSSFFASVTPRTAGFNSISTSDMTLGGNVLTIALMIIGGSPGSTAGGIKTVTLGIIIIAVICIARGKEDVETYKRRIPRDLVYKAFMIFFIAMTIIFMATLILSITEHGESLEMILYEVSSAIGTVGLTMGLTTKLSAVGKVVIMILMYMGRVGPLTVTLALGSRRKQNLYRYPEENIIV